MSCKTHKMFSLSSFSTSNLMNRQDAMLTSYLCTHIQCISFMVSINKGFHRNNQMQQEVHKIDKTYMYNV